MKYNKCLLVLSALAAVVFTGCKNEDVEKHRFDNKFYITSTILSDDLLIKSDTPGYTKTIESRLASRAAGRRDDRGRSVAGSRLQHDLWRQRRGASRRMLRTLFQPDRHCGRSGERRRDRDRVQGHQYARRQPALRAARDGHFVGQTSLRAVAWICSTAAVRSTSWPVRVR